MTTGRFTTSGSLPGRPRGGSTPAHRSPRAEWTRESRSGSSVGSLGNSQLCLRRRPGDRSVSRRGPRPGELRRTLVPAAVDRHPNRHWDHPASLQRAGAADARCGGPGSKTGLSWCVAAPGRALRPGAVQARASGVRRGAAGMTLAPVRGGGSAGAKGAQSCGTSRDSARSDRSRSGPARGRRAAAGRRPRHPRHGLGRPPDSRGAASSPAVEFNRTGISSDLDRSRRA
jgi:hypothetical protein